VFSEGNILQLCAQQDLFEMMGLNFKVENLYFPVFEIKGECIKALEILFEKRIKDTGWWFYEKDFIDFGICTQEEFDDAMINC